MLQKPSSVTGLMELYRTYTKRGPPTKHQCQRITIARLPPGHLRFPSLLNLPRLINAIRGIVTLLLARGHRPAKHAAVIRKAVVRYSVHAIAIYNQLNVKL